MICAVLATAHPAGILSALVVVLAIVLAIDNVLALAPTHVLAVSPTLAHVLVLVRFSSTSSPRSPRGMARPSETLEILPAILMSARQGDVIDKRLPDARAGISGLDDPLSSGRDNRGQVREVVRI